MKVNLNLLPFNLDEKIKIPSDFYKNTSIKDLSEVTVKGIISSH